MSDTLEATNGTVTEESADQGHRRGVALLPMLFTMGNIFCGYYAVLSIQRGTAIGFSDASRAIGFAILFDALDGRVARA
ncbi:MAG: CDP-diacylglycerol--serine O-phosphatidyltransferase, partial [Acidobacteria bacterium]|nr:CDP-diacylglycerol--serine O-phosphatidyltransferase [Acidobacteriota bacterium]